MTRRTLSGKIATLFVVFLIVLLSVCAAWGKNACKIRQGDTLWELAKKYHTTPTKLAHANGISENATLKLDRKLIIPGDRSLSAKNAVHTRRHHLSLIQQTAHKTAIVAKHKTAKSNTAEMAKQPATKPKIAEATAKQGSTRLVRTALAYCGTRYRRGGTSRGGFDCSGFTRYIYSKYGLALPHSSAAQARIGVSIPKSQLKVGDLVFFQTYRRGISHVGIYIGGGNFVHASTYGRGVTTDSMGSAYYAHRYRGARRIK